MKIIKRYLTPNEYSRPKRKRAETLGIVMHWTANPYASAQDNWQYFEARKSGAGGYGSAHYIIGQDGAIIQAMPENEVAYHCGTSQKDPASGKVYTDYAREKYGHYAVRWQNESPNLCTVGIELCPTDYEGHFSAETINAAAELCTEICKKRKLTAHDITTHHDIVGWKDCPRLWTQKPELLDAFRASVKDKITRGKK